MASRSAARRPACWKAQTAPIRADARHPQQQLKERQILLAGKAVQRQLLFPHMQIGVQKQRIPWTLLGQDIGRRIDTHAQPAQAENQGIGLTAKNETFDAGDHGRTLLLLGCRTPPGA
jgi:hypothetical protein